MPFSGIDDPAKLRRLLEATLLLQDDLSLPVLLRRLVEEACSISGARYGALGVLDGEGVGLADFITVGVEPEVERAIGHYPTGTGLLGLLITEPVPLRLADLHRHPQSAGFPPHHPQMTSFLGVPVTSRGAVYGNLYLTEKVGWSEFTRDDEAMVVALAQAAGIAIENARLHSHVQDLAVLEDRDRIARDLHDAVIQRLFAVGLTLQALSSRADGALAERITGAVADLDETIRQIRSSIFELTSTRGAKGHGLRAEVLSVVHELASAAGFEIPVSFSGPLDAAVPAEVGEQVLVTVREALANVARHAQATSASVDVSLSGNGCIVTVIDDGRGLGPVRDGGLGLENLRRRAEKLGGSLEMTTGPGGRGTALTWRVRLGA